MANDNPKIAREYYERGNKRSESFDFDGAIADYTKSLHLNPDHIPTLNNRGAVYNAKGEHDKAISDFNEAIRLNPKDGLSRTNRGNTWLAKGEHDKAIDDFNEAIRLKPDYDFAWVNRGISWSAKGEHDKAISDFNEAIRLNPGYVLTWVNRGISWSEKGEYDKAVDDLNEAARLDPKSAEIFNNRGSVWGLKNEHDKAINDFNEAIRLNPSDATVWTNRGNAWIRKGEYDKAIHDLNEAVRLNPAFQGAIHNRALALALQFSESRRKEVAEKLQKEYNKQLETVIQQYKENIRKLLDEAQDGVQRSKDLQDKAMNLLKFTVWGWISVILVTFLIDLGDNKINPYLFLTWLPAFTMISTPVFALVWFYKRESEKIKNQIDKPQQNADLEEILLRYGDDESFRKELLRHSPAQESRLRNAARNDSLPPVLPDATAKGVKAMGGTIDKPNMKK